MKNSGQADSALDAHDVTLPAPVLTNDQPDDGRVKLVAKASGRLFTALVLFLAVAVTAMIVPQWKEPPLLSPHVGFVVFLIGVIGAFVSLQRRLKQLARPDLELLADSWWYISLSPIIGGLLAAVLYVIFLAGIVSSPLFPTFNQFGSDSSTGMLRLFTSYSNDPKDYAKLIVWTFLAGYSEKFVIDILGRFESKNPG